MIPHIIHYCWFGRNPLPESAKKCIASWRKFLPDYEIWQWSEEPLHENVNDNENHLCDKILPFDVNSIPYTQQAYQAKKYAFVSDYARFWILYHEGGLYFDTDVEIIKPFDDILSRGAFMGLEIDREHDVEHVAINPGLGLGAKAGLAVYLEILKGFENLDFYKSTGIRNDYTMIPMVTDIFKKKGLFIDEGWQTIEDITIYPQRFFNPFNNITGELNVTSDTHSIHWYTASWLNQPTWMLNIKRMLRRILHKLF